MSLRRITPYLSAILLLLSFAPSGADSSLDSKLAAIESAIDAKRRELNIPGASIVIVKDDRVVLLKGMGLRDIERNLPVTPDTQFAIGSATKAFTAMTVMMCVDDGKLKLEDSPRRYLPWFALKDPEANEKITVADLLSHRSGLGRTDFAWYTGRLRPAQVIRVAGQAKPSAKLGEKFQYQNVMYLAAGEVVAAAQKQPWERFLTTRIFKPLGMKQSNLSIRRMQSSPDHALGYVYDGAARKHIQLPMRDLSCIAPAGAINSSAREMARWVRVMLNGGVIEGRRLVSEKSFAELTKRRITVAGSVGYGLGWFLREWKGHPVVEHGGNIDGFNAQVALMPDQKLGFALLTNVSASTLGPFAMQTIWEELVGPKEGPSTSSSAVAAVPPEKEAGRYLLAAANITMEVVFKDGRLTFIAPAQPPYPLENVGGRRYKLGAPAPSGFYITFRNPSPDKTEALLEQPQGNVMLEREEAAAYRPPLTVEELMSRAIQALGGEENLRKQTTLQFRYVQAYEAQGLTGRGEILQQAPNRLVETETIYALGRKIATSRDSCDGRTSVLEMSFLPRSERTGAALASVLAGADFYGDLNWKKLYTSVTITGMGKVGDEETYVVEKKPAGGAAFKDHYSAKTFLLLRRELPGTSETYSDFRPVEGVQIPHRRIRVSPLAGESTLTVTEARFGVKISPRAFALRKPGPSLPISERGPIPPYD